MYTLYANELVAALRMKDLHREAQADRLVRAARVTGKSKSNRVSRVSRVSRVVAAARGSLPAHIEVEPTFFPRLSDYPFPR